MTPVFGVAGWKNSGKTTLMERLIAEFTARGLRVAAVKHAHHTFDIDHAGTDSFRHRQAGARQVAVVSARRLAITAEVEGEAEPSLEEILARLLPCDLILVEGFKGAPHPKIETRRLEARDRRPLGGPGVVAIAADHSPQDQGLPVFPLDEAAQIADFIAHHLGLQAPAAPA